MIRVTNVRKFPMILLVTYKCWYTFDIGKIHKVRMLNLQGNLYYEREKADFFLAHNLSPPRTYKGRRYQLS